MNLRNGLSDAILMARFPEIGGYHTFAGPSPMVACGWRDSAPI